VRDIEYRHITMLYASLADKKSKKEEWLMIISPFYVAVVLVGVHYINSR